MLTKTKENIAKPKVTPAQLILFGLLMGWIVLTNLKQFADLNIGYQIGIQITFYIGIMLTAGVKGNVSGLVKSLIGIIANGESNDVKMLKLQNLVVAMCQELGLLYEQERDRFLDYVVKVAEKPRTEAEIKAELNTLEEKENVPTDKT